MIEQQEGVLYMDGYDDCVIGHCDRCGQPTIALYGIEKLIARHTKDGMTQDEAVEFIDFNQLGAWVGPETPGFVWEDL